MSAKEPVTIVLLGHPVPWARTGGGKSARRFTPTKQRNNAENLRAAAQRIMDEPGFPGSLERHEIFNEPVSLEIMAEFQIPASWSKRKRAQALLGEIGFGKRPDWDNLGKQVCDALNGVVFRDDALIDDGRVRKRYSNQPKLVITIAPIANMGKPS